MAAVETYFVFVVIPRSELSQGYQFFLGPKTSREYIPIFQTKIRDVAEGVTQRLNKDIGDGTAEDCPEGFVYKQGTEMLISDCVEAREKLESLEDWQKDLQKKAERYAEKVKKHPLVKLREEEHAEDKGHSSDSIEEWSPPMSLTQIAKRYLQHDKARPEQIKQWLSQQEVKRLSDRKVSIRLDKMEQYLRRRIENPLKGK